MLLCGVSNMLKYTMTVLHTPQKHRLVCTEQSQVFYELLQNMTSLV